MITADKDGKVGPEPVQGVVLYLIHEVGQTARQLLWGRRVVGRGAPDGGRDIGVSQRQPIVDPLRRREAREAGAVERGHEEVAGAVAGEHAAGPVRAVRGRGEAEHQQPGSRIAEARDGAAPVVSTRWARFFSRATRVQYARSRGQLVEPTMRWRTVDSDIL
ncbi:MAG TPA: hypothetical protein VND92_05665 [Vicinamibacterales bacterium]|nr:hypothetical protein [Vicinamibacterales bacterium]